MQRLLRAWTAWLAVDDRLLQGEGNTAARSDGLEPPPPAAPS